jgi:hypothetical protein
MCVAAAYCAAVTEPVAKSLFEFTTPTTSPLPIVSPTVSAKADGAEPTTISTVLQRADRKRWPSWWRV